MSTAETVVAALFALIAIVGIWVAHGLTKDLRKLIVLLSDKRGET